MARAKKTAATPVTAAPPTEPVPLPTPTGVAAPLRPLQSMPAYPPVPGTEKLYPKPATAMLPGHPAPVPGRVLMEREHPEYPLLFETDDGHRHWISKPWLNKPAKPANGKRA